MRYLKKDLLSTSRRSKLDSKTNFYHTTIKRDCTGRADLSNTAPKQQSSYMRTNIDLLVVLYVANSVIECSVLSFHGTSDNNRYYIEL